MWVKMRFHPAAQPRVLDFPRNRPLESQNVSQANTLSKQVSKHRTLRRFCAMSQFGRLAISSDGGIDEDETYRRTTLGDYFQAQSTSIADALGAKVLR